MFMTIVVFLIAAVVFFVMSFFVEGVWSYYIPVSLVILSVLLMSINSSFKNIAKGIIYRNPGLFENEEKEMLLSSASIFIPNITLKTFFIRVDPGAAASYTMYIALIYSVITLFTQNWIALIICSSIFLYILFGINVSFGGIPEDDVMKFIIRYSKAKKFDRKKLSEYEVSLLMDSYTAILDKLHSWVKQKSEPLCTTAKNEKPKFQNQEEYEKSKAEKIKVNISIFESALSRLDRKEFTMGCIEFESIFKELQLTESKIGANSSLQTAAGAYLACCYAKGKRPVFTSVLAPNIKSIVTERAIKFAEAFESEPKIHLLQYIRSIESDRLE